MKTNLSDLLKFIEYGINLLQDISTGKLDSAQIPVALLTLLYLENILDKGRILSREYDSVPMGKINNWLQEIRKGISELIDTMNRPEVEHLLSVAGDDLKRNFLY